MRLMPGIFVVATALGIAGVSLNDLDNITLDTVVTTAQVDYNKDGQNDIVAVEDPLGAPEEQRVLSIYDGNFVKPLLDGKIQVKNTKRLAYAIFTDPQLVGSGQKKYFFGDIDGKKGYDLQIVEENLVTKITTELKTYRNLIHEKDSDVSEEK